MFVLKVTCRNTHDSVLCPVTQVFFACFFLCMPKSYTCKLYVNCPCSVEQYLLSRSKAVVDLFTIIITNTVQGQVSVSLLNEPETSPAPSTKYEVQSSQEICKYTVTDQTRLQ